MPIYRIDSDKIEPIQPTTFAEQDLRERRDLQALLKTRINVISPDTLVIAEEFGQWEDSRRRIDLLGLDKGANLIVIELKRTEDGGHMDLQAIRYAAMVSTLTFDKLITIYEQYLRDNGMELTAASRLRRHLEYIAGELADDLGAKPAYRGDFSYDLGDLLPAVIGRQGELLKLAAKTANHWRDGGAKAKGEAMKTVRAQTLENYGGEQWVINKAIHYNEWASFSQQEFRAVVEAFKSLLAQFRYPKSGCESWLYVMPRKGNPEILRCQCMGINLDLKPQ